LCRHILVDKGIHQKKTQPNSPFNRTPAISFCGSNILVPHDVYPDRLTCPVRKRPNSGGATSQDHTSFILIALQLVSSPLRVRVITQHVPSARLQVTHRKTQTETKKTTNRAATNIRIYLTTPTQILFFI
jgi:hypothetical protein